VPCVKYRYRGRGRSNLNAELVATAVNYTNDLNKEWVEAKLIASPIRSDQRDTGCASRPESPSGDFMKDYRAF
jgi:hypothetical protein